jgi:hypothetical protein
MDKSRLMLLGVVVLCQTCTSPTSNDNTNKLSNEVVYKGFSLTNQSRYQNSLSKNIIEITIKLKSNVNQYAIQSFGISTSAGAHHWDYNSTSILSKIVPSDSSQLYFRLSTTLNTPLPLQNYNVVCNGQSLTSIYAFIRNDSVGCPESISPNDSNYYYPLALDSMHFPIDSLDTTMFYIQIVDTLITDFIEIDAANSSNDYLLPIDTINGPYYAGKHVLKYYSPSIKYAYDLVAYSKVINHEHSYYKALSEVILSPN